MWGYICHGYVILMCCKEFLDLWSWFINARLFKVIYLCTYFFPSKWCTFEMSPSLTIILLVHLVFYVPLLGHIEMGPQFKVRQRDWSSQEPTHNPLLGVSVLININRCEIFNCNIGLHNKTRNTKKTRLGMAVLNLNFPTKHKPSYNTSIT